MPREEIKITIMMKGDRALIGAQAPECDPKMITVQGTLQTALERVPSFIEQSNLEWDASPRNPKAPPPPPPPAPARVATTTSTAAGKSTVTKPAKPSTEVKQQKFF